MNFTIVKDMLIYGLEVMRKAFSDPKTYCYKYCDLIGQSLACFVFQSFSEVKINSPYLHLGNIYSIMSILGNIIK